MSRKEIYLGMLRRELQGCTEEFQKEIMDTFEEHFAEGEARGLSDEEIIQELGEISEVLSDIQMLKNSHMVPAAEETSASDDQGRARRNGRSEGSSSRGPAVGTGLEGTIAAAPGLRIDCLGSAVDLYLAKGDALQWKLEPESGIFFGGIFIRSLPFTEKREPEVIAENRGEECVIRVQNGGGRLYVSMPELVQDLAADTSSGDIHCRRLQLRRAVLAARSGDVEMETCRIEQLRTESVSGDVEFHDCLTGQLQMKSVSGDLSADSLTGNAELRTMSGDIKVKRHSGGTLRAESASGDVEAVSENEIFAASKSGDVEVKHEGSIPSVEASTLSGDVSCKVRSMDFTAVLTSRTGSRRCKIAVPMSESAQGICYGTGTGKIRLKSMTGDVTLS